MSLLTVALNLGDKAVDIEVLKKGNHGLDQDQNNNQLLWHIQNINEEGSAVLSFASERLAFEDIFPIDIKFDETYSLIDIQVDKVLNANSGEPMSLKTLHSLSSENYRINE